jgi:hypothetical protein
MIGPVCQDHTKDRGRRSARIVKFFSLNLFKEKDKAFFSERIGRAAAVRNGSIQANLLILTTMMLKIVRILLII